MPRPLNEILPEAAWYPNQKQQVIRILAAQPAPGNIRRDWLFLWALWVGQRVNRADYAKVQENSIEAGPF